MLQEAVTVLPKDGTLAHFKIIQSKTLGKSSMFIRGIPATLRQTLLDKEIKSTTTETATVNQTSSIRDNVGENPQANPQHDW